MNTTFFLPNSLDVNKVGPILEKIEIAIEKGENIHLITCNQIVNNCSLNPRSNYFICKSCRSNFHRIFSRFLAHKSITLIDLKNFKDERIEYPTQLLEAQTLSEFQKIYYDKKNLDVGWSVVSSHVSRSRDIKNMVSPKNIKTLGSNVRTSIDIYCAFSNYITDRKPDKIVIFNGRLFETRPVLRVCQKLGTVCSVIEIAGDRGLNSVEYQNCLPHDLDEYTQKMIDHWNCNARDDERETTAKSFFISRRNGKPTNDRSHIALQKANQLPEKFDKTKKNLVIFNSSEDEIFSIGPSWKKKFKDQAAAVKFISSAVLNDKRFTIYLRMHPNLRGVRSEFVSELLQLDCLENVEVIPPSSRVCSYKLLDEAYRIFTFGSTIGVEATYWGKPALTLSDCFYSGIKGAYSCFDLDILDFIFAHDLPKLDLNNALIYGYYQLTIGEKFKFWRKGKFNGQKIPQATNYEKVFYHCNRIIC